MMIKTVAITGITGTLGMAVCERFDRALDWNWRGCCRSGTTVRGQSVDGVNVINPSAVSWWFKTMERCDAVVTCAGVSAVAPSLALPIASWHDVIDTNLTGTFLAAREAIRSGATRIVTIGSIHGCTPTSYPQRAAYTASKGAVAALTHALAVEFAPQGIAVNCISPGHLPVIMHGTGAGQSLLDAAQRRTPTGRLTTPEEAADVIFWLCDSAPLNMTGQIIVIDGAFASYTFPLETA